MHYFFMFEWLIHICFTFIIFSIILKKYRWPKTSTVKSEEDKRLRLAWRIQPAWRQETHQKKIKYVCYLSKLKIIISYNIYDFDWFEQVTSFVLIPTSRNNKLNKTQTILMKMLKTWKTRKINKHFPGLFKINETVSSFGLTSICLGKTKIIVKKPKSNSLTISVWQKAKKQPQTYKFISNQQMCCWTNSYAPRLYWSG